MRHWAKSFKKLKLFSIFEYHKSETLNPKFSAMALITNIRHFFEKHGFEVSSRLADRLGMRATNVRLFFIYITFVTVGLWFGVYLTLAFWLKLKDMVYTKRSSVFDL
jgi:phage shock protein PspC (stress-responsive transcriptional regulator)